ncbi:MAG TPA: phage portal protein, partial [Phycisphaerae bacterium]|nr:phage portal protein [Phycisphaerae bacterium]
LRDWVTTETAPDGSEQQLVKSEPGGIITGALGDELQMFHPARPGQTFQPYVTTAIRLIGAGMGMPLELVLLDFSQTNYSSARAALLQSYRTFMTWQEFAVDDILNPVYQRWIGQGIVDGDLPLREDAFAVQWLLPKWAWIDPLKEVLAAEKATAMGIDTLTQHIAQERQTLGDYIRIRKRELEAYRTAGIPTTTAPENLSQGADAAPPAGSAPPAKGNKERPDDT